MKFLPKGLDQLCAFIVSVVAILCGTAAISYGVCATYHAQSRWLGIAVGIYMIADNGRLIWKYRTWLWPR